MLVNQLAQSDISAAVSDAMAPAFILAAISGLITAMTAPLVRAIDKLQSQSIEVADSAAGASEKIIYLKSRIKLVNRAITLLLTSAIFVVLYIIAVFVAAIFNLRYEGVVVFILIIALCLLLVSLILLAGARWRVNEQLD